MISILTLQMNYNLSSINFPNSLLKNLHGLQKDRVFCYLQIVCDDGDLWIHRAALEGWNIWWCSLLRDSWTDYRTSVKKGSIPGIRAGSLKVI